MKDFLARIGYWFDDNKWFIIGYVAFIAVFWMFAAPKMTAVTAYFGLCVLHLLYFAIVYFFKNIYPE